MTRLIRTNPDKKTEIINTGLTKQQKLEAYTYALFIALARIDDRESYDICASVCRSLGNYVEHLFGYYFFADESLQLAPEFRSQKPADRNEQCLWWIVPERDIKEHMLRIAAIEKAIELTEQL